VTFAQFGEQAGVNQVTFSRGGLARVHMGTDASVAITTDGSLSCHGKLPRYLIGKLPSAKAKKAAWKTTFFVYSVYRASLRSGSARTPCSLRPYGEHPRAS